MAAFKCRACGSRIRIKPGNTVCICPSCGTAQTPPQPSDDADAGLLNNTRTASESDAASQRQAAVEIAVKKHRQFVAFTFLIMAAFVVLLTVIVKVIIPAGKYQTAVQLIDEGDYVAAYDRLISLRDYKDSVIIANGIFSQYKSAKLKTAKSGDNVYFGTYEQDNNAENGKEDIEWFVLKRDGDKAFVISLYALDSQKFNNAYTDVTWATCSLRAWLNEAFINNAFSEEERSRILRTTVRTNKNPDFGTEPGGSTEDQVFLLSIEEVNEFFKSDEERKCAPTAYAKAQGAWTSSRYTVNGENTGWWWLRSPGRNSMCAADVTYIGTVYSRGVYADYDDDCVRPAMWIDLAAYNAE